MSSSSPGEGRHDEFTPKSGSAIAAGPLHPAAVAQPPAGARGRRERIDYSAEMKIHGNPVLRTVFLTLGLLALALGLLGVVLPGWPTTVWVIIATFFFMRSSPRFYNLVMNHRIFGPLIRDYRSGRGIPRRAKVIAVSSILLFGGSAALFIIGPLWARLGTGLLVVAGVAYLLHLPTSDALPGAN